MSEDQKDLKEQRFEDLVMSALNGNAHVDEVHALEELLIESETNRKKFIEFAAFE